VRRGGKKGKDKAKKREEGERKGGDERRRRRERKDTSSDLEGANDLDIRLERFSIGGPMELGPRFGGIENFESANEKEKGRREKLKGPQKLARHGGGSMRTEEW